MAGSSDSLADILERVLDKGVVIAGDIGISVVDVELLTLRIRLFIASAQTAREMGMDWWTNDPFFAPNAARGELDKKTDLAARVAELEARLPAAVPSGGEEPR
ncbi:gas vesicle protein [Amycolatopsis sp. NPDC051128]|uniref:gas vesicle protein n=1 Tax=Amycolatopsis sp. NPDC051128 TaxID=3155412 RepID=UPI0034181CD8